MSTVSIIQLSYANKHCRLDSEFSSTRIFVNAQWFAIDSLAKVFRGRSVQKYSTKGLPIIRSCDLDDMIDVNLYCKTESRRNLFYAQESDILVSSIGLGSIGKIQIVHNINVPLAVVPEISIIRVVSPNISPFYITVYLKSRYGFTAINDIIRGSTGQLHIYPKDIALIKIPNCNTTIQHLCESLLKESIKLKQLSMILFEQSLVILNKTIKLQEFKICHNWMVKLASANRLDPEFWHPKFELLKQHFLEKGALEYANNLLIYNNRGLQPDYINDGEILVVNSQHLGSQHVDIDSLERTNQEFWDHNPRSRIFKNDILLYTTGAYLGRTNVWLEDKKAIASNHVNILRVDENKCNPVYMAFYLNTEYGIMQSKRWQSGSGQQEIYPNDIGQMMVYLPSRDVQDEIAECVIKSYYQLRESKRLLEVAKKAVEIAIEESEERAMQYLNENQATSIEY